MSFFNTNFLAILHTGEHEHHGIGAFLHDTFGKAGVFLDEVLLHALTDTLKLIPFLFLTYLLMEFIEHKAGDKTVSAIGKAGKLGPLVGGGLGLIPQCAFSSIAANLYSGKIITVGTLIAVFLATSDEMLPLLIGSSIGAKTIAFILIYKVTVAIAVGFLADLILKLAGKESRGINVDELCRDNECHCERGILRSAIHHTLKISAFILVFTLLINTAVYFIGDENIAAIMYNKPFISHLIAAVFGLIPNCAASVALTGFYTSGYITCGTMLSGLFSGSGIGLLILFRVNKNLKANLLIVLSLVAAGALFGLLADVTGLAALFS